MDIGKAFGQMFKDPNWVKKMLFFSLFVILSIFIIGIPFVFGYMILMIRGYMDGDENLPKWQDNWELIIKTGLKFILIMIIFSAVSGTVSFFISALFNFAVILISQIDGTEFITITLSLVQMTINIIIGAIVSGINLLIMIKFARDYNFGGVFDLEWYPSYFNRNWKNIVIYLLLNMVTASLATFGIIACCIGVLATAFYAITVNSSLMAQIDIHDRGAMSLGNNKELLSESGSSEVE